MMKSPSVHIVILNWNGLDDTLECLESIRRLTYDNVTTIIVDNGSADDQAGDIEKAFPDAVVLPQSENLGFCGGCNVGIQYALENGSDYVMLLNNDTIVSEDLVAKLLDGFQVHADAAAVSPVILESPDTNKVWFSQARWEPAEAQFRISRPGEKYEDLRSRDA